MSVIIFLTGLVLGICFYAIARWIEYYVDTRREDRRRFTHHERR